MWDALGGHDRGYVNLRPTFSESSLHTLHSPRWMYATIFNRLQESEILVENWLKIVRVFISHAYLASVCNLVDYAYNSGAITVKKS